MSPRKKPTTTLSPEIADVIRSQAETIQRLTAALERATSPAPSRPAFPGPSHDTPPDPLDLSSRHEDSTVMGTEMTSAEFAKLPGETRRRIGIAKKRASNHAFPSALYKKGKTVTEWAEDHGLDRNIVKSWWAKGKALRPIPRKIAEKIARDYPTVTATADTWRGGIKD